MYLQKLENKVEERENDGGSVIRSVVDSDEYPIWWAEKVVEEERVYFCGKGIWEKEFEENIWENGLRKITHSPFKSIFLNPIENL